MTPARQSAFVSPLVDGTLLGGIFFPVLAVILLFQIRLPDWVGLACTYLAISPHYFPGWYRLYGDRETISRFHGRTVVAPLVLFVVVLVVTLLAPKATPLFLTVFGIWRLHHLSSQTLGVSLVYLQRLSLAPSRLYRHSLMALLLGASYWTLLAHPDVFTAPLMEPLKLHGAPKLALAGLVVLAALPCLWQSARWMLSGGFLFAIPILVYVVYLYFSPRNFAAQTFLAATFHGTQHLLLSWVLAVRAPARERLTLFGRMHHSRWWMAWVLAGGAAMVWFVQLSGKMLIAGGADPAWAYMIAAAGLNYHHFITDAVVWRRKLFPEVALLSAPLEKREQLFANLSEPLRPLVRGHWTENVRQHAASLRIGKRLADRGL